MIIRRFRRLLAAASLILFCLAAAVPVSAVFQPRGVRYQNPDTGYRVVILDEQNLLTAREEAMLAEEMKPITQYGNVAFWTTDEYKADYVDQARLMRKALFEFESATIFMINMNTRKLAIQSYGAINETITSSKARSITDNVSGQATKGDYYGCASKAFRQILRVADQGTIPEPMRLLSYATLCVMAAALLMLFLLFWRQLAPAPKVSKAAEAAAVRPQTGFRKLLARYRSRGAETGTPAPERQKINVVLNSLTVNKCKRYKTEKVEITRGSDGSGSSCSSCSSGSSCSSCSSCGSGGGSSF